MSRSGEAPIFARLTISGQRAEFNINRSVDPDNWNAAKGLSKGKSKRDLELNKYLDSIRVRISEIHTMLVKEEEVINPNVIKRFDRGDICDGTYLRWKRCAEYLSEFLQKREGREDVPIKKLTSGMIDDFEHFLRVNKGNSNNTAIRTTTNRGFLTEDEVKRIMALDFTELPRLDQVRDTFIFCCFTGLAFADISTLTRDFIIEDANGELWIRKPRQKTGEISTIPLLDIPHKLIKKYENHPTVVAKGVVLPVISSA